MGKLICLDICDGEIASIDVLQTESEKLQQDNKRQA